MASLRCDLPEIVFQTQKSGCVWRILNIINTKENSTKIISLKIIKRNKNDTKSLPYGL